VGTPPPPVAPSAPASIDAPPATDLHGVVVDESGRPLAGVRILVERDGGFADPTPPVASGADGRFVLRTTSRARYTTVRARAPGRVLVGSEAALEASETARLVMVPACVVTVRVLDASSRAPVEGALVRAVTGTWVMAVFSDHLEAPFADEGRTDAQGVCALATEGGPADVLVAPGEHAPVLVSRVNVPPEGRDLEVLVSRGGALDVRVLDPRGSPVHEARVEARASPMLRRGGTTGRDGRVRLLGIPTEFGGPHDRLGPDTESKPPHGLVLAEAPGVGAGRAAFEPPKAGETVAVELTLAAPRRVRGRVETVEGTPAPGYVVSAEPMEADRFATFARDRWTATTQATGAFAIEDAFPGSWYVTVRDATGSMVTGANVEVAEDADPDALVLVLPDRRGRMTVRVVAADGTPVQDVAVEVDSGPPIIAAVAHGRTGADGRVALEGLPVDSAKVQARPPRSSIYSTTVGPAELRGREVEIRLGAGALEGRVLRADGSPARVRLHVERLYAGCVDHSTPFETDAQGRFRLERLPEGDVSLGPDDESVLLVGADFGFETGQTNVVFWVVGVEESARFHLEFVLLDDATSKPVTLEGFCGVDLSPAGGTKGPRLTVQQSDAVSEPGRFVAIVPIPPGTYDAEVRVSGWRPARVRAVTIPRTGDPPVVRLDRGAAVEGRVTDRAGKPIEGVRVGLGGQAGTSDEDGAYAVRGLEGGELEAQASGDFVVATKRRVVVPRDGAARVDWVLDAGGSVRIPRSGDDESPPELRLLSPGGATPLDSVGAYDAWWFRGLAPGPYRLEATWPDGTRSETPVDVLAGKVADVALPTRVETPPR
jgi:hypothetical protein